MAKKQTISNTTSLLLHWGQHKRK